MIKKIFCRQGLQSLKNIIYPNQKLSGQSCIYRFSSQNSSTIAFPRLQDLNEMTMKKFEDEKIKNLTLLDYLQKISQQIGQESQYNDINLLLSYGKQMVMLCMANDTSRGDYYMVEFYKIIIQTLEKSIETCQDPLEKGKLQGKYFMALTTLAVINFNQGYLDQCFESTKKILALYNGKRNDNNKQMVFIPDNVFYISNQDEKINNQDLSNEIEFFYCDKASVLFQQIQNYEAAQGFSDRALEITLQIQNKPGSFYFNAFNQNISLILLSGNNEQVIARYNYLIEKFDYNKIKGQKPLLDKYSQRVIQAMQLSMNFFKDKFNIFWDHYKKFKTDTKYKQKRDELLRIHYTYIHNNNPKFFKDNQELVDNFINKYDDLFLQKFKDIFFVPLKQKQQPLYDYCMFLQHTESSYKQGLQSTLQHLNILKQSGQPILPEFEQMFYKNIKVFIQLDFFIEHFSKEILSLNDIESEPLKIMEQINFMSDEKQQKIHNLVKKYERKIE